MEKKIEPHDYLVDLEAALEGDKISDELKAILPELIAELKHARSALTRTMETVANPFNWDNADSALERIGDAVDSPRYPVWENYEKAER